MPSVLSEGGPPGPGVEGTPDDQGRARFYRIARLPSSVRAFGPATFPGGEGFLRRGLRTSELMCDFQGSPPHPSGLCPDTLSKQERAFFRCRQCSCLLRVSFDFRLELFQGIELPFRPEEVGQVEGDGPVIEVPGVV